MIQFFIGFGVFLLFCGCTLGILVVAGTAKEGADALDKRIGGFCILIAIMGFGMILAGLAAGAAT